MRNGYTNKTVLEFGRADGGDWHADGRNRMRTAMARRGKVATVVLTGNPGSPGVPSGPCDITDKAGG